MRIIKRYDTPAIPAKVIDASVEANDKDVYSSNAVKYFLELLHPIQSIYLTTDSTNPHDVFGFGTWELWGSGKVPVGVDPNDELFNEVEKTGGEKSVLLDYKNLPPQVVVTGAENNGADTSFTTGYFGDFRNLGQYYHTDLVRQTRGYNTAHNNLQPYITCYMWKRIA